MEKIIEEIISIETGKVNAPVTNDTNGQSKREKTLHLCVKALRYLCVLVLLVILRTVFNHFVQSGEKRVEYPHSHRGHNPNYPYGWRHINPYVQSDPKTASIRQNGYQLSPPNGY